MGVTATHVTVVGERMLQENLVYEFEFKALTQVTINRLLIYLEQQMMKSRKGCNDKRFELPGSVRLFTSRAPD